MENIFKRVQNFIKEFKKSPAESMHDYLESLQTKDPVLRRYELKQSELVRMSKNWRKNAKETLAVFIKNNPDKIDGYNFYRCHNTSDSPYYDYATVKKLSNGNFCIEEKNPYKGWDSKPQNVDYEYLNEKDGYTSKSLAELLISPNCSEMRHTNNEDYFDNSARHDFLREFEKQTGFNLKKEIQNKSQK